MLGSDVAVPQLEGFAERELENLLGARGERGRAGGSGTGKTDRLLDLLTHGLEGDPEGLERLCRDTLTLVDQPEEDVLGADEAVIEQARLLLGQHQDSTSSVCESFEHPTASIQGSVAEPEVYRRKCHSHSHVSPPRHVSVFGILAYRL